MAEISEANRNHAITLDIKDDPLDNDPPHSTPIKCNDDSPACLETVYFVQQIMAEFVGTYLLMLIGFASLVLNINLDKIMTFPGVAILWGLHVMVMVYAVGHISGAHFNPAVTIALATCKRFAWKRVPAYICAQLLGSTLASGTLHLIFNKKQLQFVGTVPAGSYMQSLAVEFLITFYLMFAVSGAVFDDRAPKEFAGIVVGGIIAVISLFAGPISGASMNPVRSLGPAIVSNCYKGIWIYIVGPIAGAISGCWVYYFITSQTSLLAKLSGGLSSNDQQPSVLGESREYAIKKKRGLLSSIRSVIQNRTRDFHLKNDDKSMKNKEFDSAEHIIQTFTNCH